VACFTSKLSDTVSSEIGKVGVLALFLPLPLYLNTTAGIHMQKLCLAVQHNCMQADAAAAVGSAGISSLRVPPHA
jgi:hypothetical protein